MSAIPSPMPENPSQKAWEFLARVARERREFIQLSQEDLATFGGPKKSTVGKIENARETSYSPRTQQQLEKALGWPRGKIRDVLYYGDEYADRPEDLEAEALELIEAPLPDLTRPESVGGGDDDDDVLLYRRPAGLTDDEWRQMKARTRALVEWEIEQALKDRATE